MLMKKFITLLLVLTGMVCTANADDWYLRGDFNNWGTDNKFVANETTVTLTAGQIIHFKLTTGETWYGNNGTMQYYSCTSWLFETGKNDCYLTAGDAGTYTFTLSDGPRLSVTYPGATVYFCNNLSWTTPNMYKLSGEYWSGADNGGSGSQGQAAGVAMTRIGTTNIWKASLASNIGSSYIAFLKDKQDNYEHFYNTKAVYRGDFGTNKALYVPNTTSNTTKNGTDYYNNGEWHAYPTYTRSVTEGNFGTICVPFNATVTGATVFKIVSKTVDSGSNLTGINLESVDALEAGKAYIFKATGTTLTATYSGSFTEASAGYGMMGNIGADAIHPATGNYVVGTDNLIHKVTGDGVNVGQYKAYITLAGIDPGARGADYLGFADSETTGIETVKANQTQNGEYFNLAGQRVAQPTKGLYIVNGKKVIIK